MKCLNLATLNNYRKVSAGSGVKTSSEADYFPLFLSYTMLFFKAMKNATQSLEKMPVKKQRFSP